MFKFFEKILQPYPEKIQGVPPKKLIPFIWSTTDGLRGYVLSMAGLAALVAIYDAMLFAVLGRVVDWLSSTSPQTIWQEKGAIIITLAIILIASIALVALQTTIKHQVLAINFPLRLRWNFHRLMLLQSMSFYSDEFAGRVTAKIMQTALAVRDMLFTTTDVVVGMCVYMVSIIILAGSFDILLSIPFLIWLIAYILVGIYFVPRLEQVSREQADARSVMTGRITDAYANIATVKLFSHNQREEQFAKQAMQEFQQTGYAQMRMVSLFEITNHTLIVLLILSSSALALNLWMNEEVGMGAIAAVTAMALRLSGMSQWAMWEISRLFESVGTIQDGIQTLSRPQTVLDAPDASLLKVQGGAINFENISFEYTEQNKTQRPVINNMNLQIKAGEKIGLIGRSGAGKSTLVNLLLRFYDLKSGQIQIDGQDISKVTQDSLRQHIGMVTQDTSLLHRTVRDNITYGRPNASQEEIEKAVSRAQASDFIPRLTDAQGRTGYEAHVGERGVKLSGGQRQRIAIARVMLKDAPILLLDEATSALDSEVEAAIQENLNELMQGKTVIAIAHRLSTIASMDRLIVLDKGKIIEEGTHQELLAKKGIYAKLWNRQSGGFLGED